MKNCSNEFFGNVGQLAFAESFSAAGVEPLESLDCCALCFISVFSLVNGGESADVGC